MSFPENDYRAPYIPGRTSPGPTSTGPMHLQSAPQTYQQFPPTGGFPVPPPKKKSHTLAIVLWSVLGALVLLFVGIGASGGLAGSAAKAPSVVATTAEQPAAAAATPAKTYPTPALTDFALAVKVTKKQCFGSAGCNIDFTISLDYKGPALEPNSSWDITFDMTGVEDPYTATLHMTLNDTGLHGTYEQDSDQQVQTKSSKAVLKAVVTSVTAA